MKLPALIIALTVAPGAFAQDREFHKLLRGASS